MVIKVSVHRVLSFSLVLSGVLMSCGSAKAASPRPALERYDHVEAKKLVPLLAEVLAFPTFEGNEAAMNAQRVWLANIGARLDFQTHEAGTVTEIELAGPAGAPVLGLMVHGDVERVDVERWSCPPFAARVADGHVCGRGAADDKGPLIQALLAMHALKESGLARTHSVRLLVGSDEESGATDIDTYLESHQAPNYTLVLDSAFPVVIGEKAWNVLAVRTPLAARESSLPYEVMALQAGLSPSIVPDSAELRLRWCRNAPSWTHLETALKKTRLPDGIRLTVNVDGDTLSIRTHGRSAHAGVNIEAGRNALVALAQLMEGRLPPGGADDLLAFARLAGQDLYGAGLGLTDVDPLWGRYVTNVATVRPDADDPNRTALTINVRSTPSRTGEALKSQLAQAVAVFNRRTGSSLEPDGAESYYRDSVLAFRPDAKLVKRLLAVYERATGEVAKPVISAGGTYAKRFPRAIAFGMWFPGKPYPGHDVDERVSLDDLHRGARVLIHALVDIATKPVIEHPFDP